MAVAVWWATAALLCMCMVQLGAGSLYGRDAGPDGPGAGSTFRSSLHAEGDPEPHHRHRQVQRQQQQPTALDLGDYVLEEFSVTPQQLSKAGGSTWRVTVRVRIRSRYGLADEARDASLFWPSQAQFLHETSEQLEPMIVNFYPALNLVEGDAFAGTFESEVHVPAWNSQGRFLLEFLALFDTRGPEAVVYVDLDDMDHVGMHTEFSVLDADSDTFTPWLIDLAIDTRIVNSTENQRLLVYLSVEEFGSGLASKPGPFVEFSFVEVVSLGAPAAQAVRVTGHFTEEDVTDYVRAGLKVSAQSRVYCAALEFPQWAWTGLWQIHAVHLEDTARNSVTWTGPQLLGFGSNHQFVLVAHNLTYLGLDIFDYAVTRQQESEEYYEDEAESYR